MTHFLMSPPCRHAARSSQDFSALYREWQSLGDTLERVGCRVTRIPTAPGVDSFFALSRHALIVDRTIILNHQRGPRSHLSSPYFSAWCQASELMQTYRVESPRLHPDRLEPLLFSGEADTLIVDNTLYFGYGGLSAHDMANDLVTKTGKRVVDLSILSHQHTLMDCLVAVHDGQLLCHLDRIHPNSVAVLADHFAVTEHQDAPEYFPSHSLILDEHAIVADNCYETQAALGAFGYDVIPLEFKAFQSLGFGPRALVMTVPS